ncbi:MAG: PRC-barrel domain-containing protein, partial [Pseudomonadota bacterium]
VGPGAGTPRPQAPDLDHHGQPKIVPMRLAADIQIAAGDADPRGMSVVGADGEVAGAVSDVWVDRPEALVRYLEVTLKANDRQVLLPITQAVVRGKQGKVMVDAITADQFKDVPTLSDPHQVTLDEEERVCAYYGAGYLYAVPSRAESWA